MTAHLSNHRPSEVALHHLLACVASELAHLHQDNKRIEEMLGEVLAHSGCTAAPAAVQLQSIDRMTQTLDALTQFLAELARGLDPSLTVDPTDAIGQVSLRDLALSLTGQVVTERAFPPHHSIGAAGIVDFF